MSQTLSALYTLQSLVQTPKRQVFVSSFHADRREVDNFILRWGKLEGVFTANALCTFDNDDFIDSNNPEYVMSQIRQRYLYGSSVTILLIGKCTHSRRYVDWELKSSLRQGLNTPNGLLAYVLPSAMPPDYGVFGPIPWNLRAWPALPDRLAANWDYNRQDQCYARYFVMPTSADQLREQIEAAFSDRTDRAHLIKNDASMMKYNSKCRVCGETH